MIKKAKIKKQQIVIQREIMKKCITQFGSQLSFAKAIKVSQPTIHRWLKCIYLIPPEKALIIEQVTFGVISKHEIRSDIFPPNVEKVMTGAVKRKQLSPDCFEIQPQINCRFTGINYGYPHFMGGELIM